MPYNPPAKEILDNRASQIQNKYTRNNPHRKKLIEYFIGLHQILNEVLLNDFCLTEQEKSFAYLGIWIMMLCEIEQNSWLNPTYKPRPFLSTGSTLYQIILDALNVTEENQLTDEDKLIYLTKLYQFTKAHKEELLSAFQKQHTDFSLLQNAVNKNIKWILNRMQTAIIKLTKKMPNETMLDKRMLNLYSDYQLLKNDFNRNYIFSYANKSQGDRLFQIQLATAIAGLLSTSEQNDGTSSMINRDKRIKLGILLYILENIKKTYHIRSPFHSQLFKLCCQSLNIDDLKEMNEHTKIICLSAFKTFLSDASVIAALEDYGHKHFAPENLLSEIDPKIFQLHIELNKILDRLIGNNQNKTNWPATKSLSQLGALILSAPGYGVGYVIGYSAADTQTTIRPKMILSDGLNYLGTTFLGLSHGYLGFLAADFIVQSTISRAMAKLLEQIGMMIGQATGGAIGLLVDVSYSGLCSLYQLYLHLYRNMPSPNEALSPLFIEALINLPSELLADNTKLRLENILDRSVPTKDLFPMKP